METTNIENKTKEKKKKKESKSKKKKKTSSLKKLSEARKEKHLELSFLIGLRNATKAFKSLVFPDN